MRKLARTLLATTSAFALAAVPPAAMADSILSAAPRIATDNSVYFPLGAGKLKLGTSANGLLQITAAQNAALLAAVNTWAGLQTFNAGINVSGGSVAIPNGNLTSAGTGQFAAFVVGNGTTGAFKGVQSTYDTTNNVGAIQSIWSGNAYTPLKINPGGGTVTTAKNTLDDGAGNAAVAGALGVTGPLTAPVKAAGATAAVDLGTREAVRGYISTDFGAKCDGTTNDTTAMQALVNASAGLGVQITLVPRGKTCLVDQIAPVSNLHAGIYGLLKSTGAAKSLIRAAAGVNNIVLEGDGTLDDGFPASGPAPSASAPTSCIDTTGAVSNWTVRGLTLQNCGNFPVNMVAYTSTPGGGSQHIYFSYVQAIGAGNRNSFEFADGCDDCRADNITVSGLAGDIDFAFYGNVTNSSVTNSHFYGGAFGVAVLSDGTAGQSLNSYPSSNILIQGNEISGTLYGAIEVHGASTAASSYHHAIRIIGNDGHGNNTTGGTYGGGYAGGETILECDGCYSSGNFWHDDGPGGSNTAPIAGISLFAAAKNFTSVGDTVYNEGTNGGQGIGAAIATGASKPAFYAFRAYDNQATPTMVQSIAGSCAADCTIIGTKTSGFSNPWGGLTINSASSYMQNDVSPFNYFSGNLYPANVATSGVLAATGAASQLQLGSQSATGTPALLAYSSGSSTQDYTVQYSGGTAGTVNKGSASYTGSSHAFVGPVTAIASGTYTDPASGTPYDLKLGGTNSLAVQGSSIFVGGAVFKGAPTFQLQSIFSNGVYADPASGTAYDAKFGGPGAGIAVAGASLFNGAVTAKGGIVNAAGLTASFSTTAGAWQSYTPTATCSSGSLTTATASGKYQASTNKRLTIKLKLAITTAGSCTGTISLSLPSGLGAVNDGFTSILSGREDTVTTGTVFQGQLPSGSSAVTLLAVNSGGSSTTFTPANNWQIDMSGAYESQ